VYFVEEKPDVDTFYKLPLLCQWKNLEKIVPLIFSLKSIQPIANESGEDHNKKGLSEGRMGYVEPR
jgi:hypothetical protein